jgi:hypothetical protein
MMGQLAGIFLVGHLFFGGGLGVIVGYGVSRKVRAAPAAAIGETQTKAAHQAEQFRCTACGAVFKTQAELMEHVKEAHPMPAR